jgi:PadR family transcriptional regulator AphA
MRWPWRGRTTDPPGAELHASSHRRRAAAAKARDRAGVSPPVHGEVARDAAGRPLDRYIGQIYPSERMSVPVPARARKARENRTRYVVLGKLGEAPMTGYGLRKAIDGSVGHFWQESFGQLYPTLRALVAEGLVDARATRGGPGRAGATYHVTPRGRAALARWLASPPVLEPHRNEVLLKVYFAGAIPPEITVRNLEPVAAALRAQRGELEAIATEMESIPERRRHRDAPYWRLTLDFGLEFTGMALAWIARAQSVLRARTERPRRSR